MSSRNIVENPVYAVYRQDREVHIGKVHDISSEALLEKLRGLYFTTLDEDDYQYGYESLISVLETQLQDEEYTIFTFDSPAMDWEDHYILRKQPDEEGRRQILGYYTTARGEDSGPLKGIGSFYDDSLYAENIEEDQTGQVQMEIVKIPIAR